MNRPNVLFVIADQLRADHVGFDGNTVVATPHLDQLADRSTVFERTFVSNPVCMPNRSTIMTGRMPSAHGVVFNDRSLSLGANTFVRQLSPAGYRTALIGKSHLQHGMSHDAVFPFPGDPGLFDPRPQGWNTIENADLGDTPTTPRDSDNSSTSRTIQMGSWVSPLVTATPSAGLRCSRNFPGR